MLNVKIRVPETLRGFIETVRSIPRQLSGSMQRRQAQVGSELRGLAVAASPRRSGTFASGWATEITGRRVRLYNVSPHAAYVMGGTGLFGPNRRLITPQTGQVLVFEKEGETKFRRWSRGIPPRNVIAAIGVQGALNRAGEGMLDDVDRALRS